MSAEQRGSKKEPSAKRGRISRRSSKTGVFPGKIDAPRAFDSGLAVHSETGSLKADYLLSQGYSRSKYGQKLSGAMLGRPYAIVGMAADKARGGIVLFDDEVELSPMESVFNPSSEENVRSFLQDFSEEDLNQDKMHDGPSVEDVLETALCSLERSNILAAESIAEISVLKRDIDVAARDIDRSLARTDGWLKRLGIDVG